MKNKSALKLVASDSDIVRCFDAALHNVVKINTVRCRYKQYNKTGLLKHPYMVRAGRNYKTPWTRDASINTWQAQNSKKLQLFLKAVNSNFSKFIRLILKKLSVVGRWVEYGTPAVTRPGLPAVI